jgi:hypothetical protein
LFAQGETVPDPIGAPWIVFPPRSAELLADPFPAATGRASLVERAPAAAAVASLGEAAAAPLTADDEDDEDEDDFTADWVDGTLSSDEELNLDLQVCVCECVFPCFYMNFFCLFYCLFFLFDELFRSTKSCKAWPRMIVNQIQMTRPPGHKTSFYVFLCFCSHLP